MLAVTLQIPASELADPEIAESVAVIAGRLGQRHYLLHNVPGQVTATDTAPPAPVTPGVAPIRRRGKATATPAATTQAAPTNDGDAFIAEQKERPRLFLTALRDRGRMTPTEAAEVLGLEGTRGVSGIVGGIRAWAEKRGVDLPYAVEQADGHTVYAWRG